MCEHGIEGIKHLMILFFSFKNNMLYIQQSPSKAGLDALRMMLKLRLNSCPSTDTDLQRPIPENDRDNRL